MVKIARNNRREFLSGDEHTREALAVDVNRRIDADRTVGVLERIVGERGRPPELVRMDNGPELTANALRDWCRLGGSGSCYIEPGSPWENPPSPARCETTGPPAARSLRSSAPQQQAARPAHA